MNFEEELEKIELIRDYEVSKARLKGTLKLINLRNQDIDELMKKLDAIRAGEELEISLRDVVTSMLDDLDELELLMDKKRQFEREIIDLGIGEKED